MFLLHLGDSPRNRVVQHFIEGREFEYTLTDLLTANVSWRTLNKLIPQLLNRGLIEKTRKIGRATLYRINKQNPVAQQLIIMYDYVITQEIKKI